MNPLTITRRALRDVYGNVGPLFVALVVWWVLAPTVVMIPAATLWLFTVADPRLGTDTGRPPFRESLSILFRSIWRGWKLATCTVPVVALMVFNVRYYGSSDGVIGVLTPVWLLLVVVGTLWTLTVFALAALREHPLKKTLRIAGQIVVYRLFTGIAVLILTLVGPFLLLGSLGWFTLPLIMTLPAITASALDRFVLNTLAVPIYDPNAPTPERVAERASGAAKPR